jgi:hypothetical protein
MDGAKAGNIVLNAFNVGLTRHHNIHRHAGQTSSYPKHRSVCG